MRRTLDVCTSCWELNCHCKIPKQKIDEEIFDILKILNKKGYETRWSCAGHIKDEEILMGIYPQIYIMFNKYNCGEIKPEDIGEGWKFTKSDYTLSKILKKEGLNYRMAFDKNGKKQNPLLNHLIAILSIHRAELKEWADNLPNRRE